MTDPVRHHARTRPGAPAVVTPRGTTTWAALDGRVGAAARRLAGWEGGVPAVVRPGLEAVVLVLAALRAGVPLVPLSPRWPPARLAGALDRLGLDRVVTDDPALALPGTVALDEVAAPGPDGPFAPLHAARVATLVHTSGTTGAPRAAVHTWGAHVASAEGLAARVPLSPADRWLLDLPLAHVGGLGVVVRCALAGAAVAVPDAGTPTAEAVRTLGATHASLVSTQLVRLLREAALPPLRAVLLGGSAMPAGGLDEAHARGLPVATSYGLTEMTSTVTATAPGAPRDELATSGTVLPGRALRLRDGEIQVRGAALFAGYAGGPGGALQLPLTPDGWYATGDEGQLDAAGRLVVTGRRGLQFVSGGENVQPEAIEAALAAVPDVAEAVVVPVADAEFGHRPVAFVRPRGEHLPPPAALAAALRRTLPGFMVPVAFHAWGGTEGMKPDRRALADEAAARWKEAGGHDQRRRA